MPNGHKVKSTLMSTSWQMDKQNVVEPHNGILLSPEEELGSATCSRMDEPWSRDAQ